MHGGLPVGWPSVGIEAVHIRDRWIGAFFLDFIPKGNDTMALEEDVLNVLFWEVACGTSGINVQTPTLKAVIRLNSSIEQNPKENFNFACNISSPDIMEYLSLVGAYRNFTFTSNMFVCTSCGKDAIASEPPDSSVFFVSILVKGEKN